MFSDCLPIYPYFVFYYRYLRRRDVAQAQGEYILIIVWAISMTSYFSLQPTKQNCAPPYEWENTDDSLWYDRGRRESCTPRHTPQKCAKITSAEKQFICSSSVCGG